MHLNKGKLRSVISRFKNKNILVVGDLVLDHYIFGKVDRVSLRHRYLLYGQTGKILSVVEQQT